MTSTYVEFFLSSARSVRQLELLEIFHPAFSRTYYVVRNEPMGLTVTHEDSSTKVYEYYPMRITRNGATDDLDSSLNIDLGDLGALVSAELDRVRTANAFGTRPVVKFRVYRSDNLNAPIFGPFKYEVVNFAQKKEGVSFTAQAPSLNIVKTGERYLPDRFPMLRGFL